MTGRACAVLYNFVLSEGHHTIWVGGIACATLGHGLDGDVIGHPFLGSYDLVTKSLSELEGFESGVLHVTMTGARCQDTGALCGFQNAMVEVTN